MQETFVQECNDTTKLSSVSSKKCENNLKSMGCTSSNTSNDKEALKKLNDLAEINSSEIR